MISFLIPIFNYDITSLVDEIIRSAEYAQVEYEILAYDDGSNVNFCKVKNAVLEQMPKVKYKLLEKNIGRSAIRNLLAKDAQGEWFCFVDCDSGLNNNIEFVKNYIDNSKEQDIICGGRIYKPFEKVEKDFVLHWKSGVERENINSQKHKPAFLTCNFFIRKKVFDEIKFDENIKQYGHEDTIFGIMLEQKDYKVLYINNPVIHLDLKNTERFLSDTRKAQENLKHLYLQPQYKNLLKNLRIIKAYNFLRKIYMDKVFLCFAFLMKPFVLWRLKIENPSLVLLDFYKLYIFIKTK